MFSRIYLRVFCYPTEEEIKVKAALLFIAFGKTDPLLQQHIRQKMSSDKSRFPIIFEVVLEKNQDIKKFSGRLHQMFLPEKLEEAIDDNCNLFLRFSKQDAFHKKALLIKHGDSIFCKAKIKVFPSKKQQAIEQFREYLLYD